MNSTPVSSVRPVTGVNGQIAKQPAIDAASPGRPRPAEHPTLAAEVSNAASEPPIDGQRVDRIRRALAGGSYQVTPDKIADALIAAGASLRRSK